jgi:protease I
MTLDGQHVAVLVDREFEDLEFWVPLMRLEEAGAEVTIVGSEAGVTHTGKHGLTATTDAAAAMLDADTFDGIVVPGGWAPDKLRRHTSVTGLVRDLYEQEKPVGLICHAGLVGISAGIVDGHRATGSTGIKDDLINAGATWVDEPAFRDGPLVWGRVVKDIPAFCRTLVAALEDAA